MVEKFKEVTACECSKKKKVLLWIIGIGCVISGIIAFLWSRDRENCYCMCDCDDDEFFYDDDLENEKEEK